MGPRHRDALRCIRSERALQRRPPSRASTAAAGPSRRAGRARPRAPRMSDCFTRSASRDCVAGSKESGSDGDESHAQQGERVRGAVALRPWSSSARCPDLRRRLGACWCQTSQRLRPRGAHTRSADQSLPCRRPPTAWPVPRDGGTVWLTRGPRDRDRAGHGYGPGLAPPPRRASGGAWLPSVDARQAGRGAVALNAAVPDGDAATVREARRPHPPTRPARGARQIQRLRHFPVVARPQGFRTPRATTGSAGRAEQPQDAG